MKIAMIGIYGGVNRDFNPGNVLIAFYTKNEILRRSKDAEIDIFSLDFSLQKCIKKEVCFANKPYEMEITFFSSDKIDEVCDIFCKQYDAVVLGGDIVIGISDVFFLKKLVNTKNHPNIIMNVVSTLWRPHLISDYQKDNLRVLAEACDYISVRERYVEEVFRSCEISKEIYLVPDPVLLHKKDEWPVSQNVLSYLTLLREKEKKIVGISDCFLREKDMVEALIKSSMINNYTVLFFSYSKRYEHSEKTQRYRQILGNHCEYLTDYLDPWETYSLIENLDLCIGNAYHCCMSAVTVGVPFIGIDPSPFESSRHTDILYDKELLSKNLLKAEVVNNDHSGYTLQNYLENYMGGKSVPASDVSEERRSISEHFNRICDMLS